MTWQRVSTAILSVIVCLQADPAHAMPVYGYSFGVSLQNTVVPGSIVAISAELKNTRDAPIVFPTRFIGGMPSVQGGSVPSATVSDRPGDWSLLGSGFNFGPTFGVSDLRTQFQGVTINPGETFSFIYATFQAPTTEPLGSSAAGQLNFSIRFTDSITGNLLGISPYSGFDNAPIVTFRLGSSPSESGKTFFEGIVVDTTTGELISGPSVSAVPEPSSLTLLGIGFLSVAGCCWRRRFRTASTEA